MILRLVSNCLIRVEKFILIFSVLAMALISILNVVSRNLFNYSFSFAEEASQFLIIAITFIGLSYAITEARHIRMSAVYDLLSHRWRKFLMLIICLGTSFLLLALCYWSVGYVQVVHTLGSTSAALSVPLAYVYVLAPVGLGLSSLRYFMIFLKNLTNEPVYLSLREKE